MIKRKKGTRIYKNFIISYIVTLMVPMFIMSVIVLYSFVNVLKDEVEANLRNPFIKSIDNLDAQLDQLTKTSLQIELNNFLRTVNIHSIPYSAISVKNELLKYNTNSFYDEIFIYNYRDDYIFSYNYLCTLDVFNSFILGGKKDLDLLAFRNSNQEDGYHYFPMDSIYLANRQNHLMYLHKIPVRSTKPYGIIMYTIPESALRSVLEPAISGNSSLFIIDPATREIMFHFSEDENEGLADIFQQTLYSRDEISGASDLNILGEKYSSYVYESKSFPFIFIQLMPNTLLTSRLNQIHTIYLISMAIIIILSGIVIAILMRINYRPIKNLKKMLEDTFPSYSKSIVQDKLDELELLEHALLHYNRENIDLKEYSTTSRKAVKSYLIDCFLSGQAREIDNIVETCKKAGLDFSQNYYCAIVLKGCNIQSIPDINIEQAVASIYKPEHAQIYLHRDIHINSTVLILGNASRDENSVRLMADQLLKLLNEQYDNELRIGVGNYYDNIFRIDASYEEAIKVLDYNKILGKSYIVCYSNISKKREKNIQYPLDLFEKLEEAVRKNDAFSIEDTVNQLVSYMKKENISLYWAKNICYDTINTISRVFLKKYNHSPLVNKPYIDKIYGADVNTFANIESIMGEIAGDTVGFLKDGTDSYALKLLQQIILYIQENYSNPDFSLQSLADSLQMSTPYLSQYFKKNTDYTISDYATRLRMEKAKDLLLKTDLSVQEIAAQAGYYSVSSFIRKFREKENITPGQFKKKYG